jgi:peptidyl-prolyl cis-trans isomerase B (cyclophilin B)
LRLTSLTLPIILAGGIAVAGAGPQEAGKNAATDENKAQATEAAPEKKAETVATLHTTMGAIVIGFYPDTAPEHVKNFVDLSKSGFYDGTTFHRVIPGFMIQGGDPNSKDDNPANDGSGDGPRQLKAEFSDISHERGIVSMARSNDPNSASCQFFIVQKASKFLDNQYSVFGHVIEGMDVVDQIIAVPRDARDRPKENVTIERVEIGPAS